jgi:WD40 repeat protein
LLLLLHIDFFKNAGNKFFVMPVIRGVCFFFLFLTGHQLLAQAPRLVLPIGHTMRVNTAVFSPDGKKILTASDDKTAKLWDAATGYLLADLKGHFGYVLSADFSPACDDDINGGSKIVTASKDKTAKIWDAITGNLLFELKGHGESIYFAKFSSDGKKIITASEDGLVKIWDAYTGIFLKDINRKANPVDFVNFDATGNKIATISGDGIIVWNANTGEKLSGIKLPATKILSTGFSPDGKKIFSICEDGNGRVHDVSSGKLLYTLVNLSPKDMESFSSGNNNERGKRTASRNCAATFSPDSRTIVSLSDDGVVKFWDAVSGGLKKTTYLKINITRVPGIEFSPDGKRVLLSMIKEQTFFSTKEEDKDDGGITKILDAASGKLLNSLTLPVDTWSSGFFSHFSPVAADDSVGGKHVLTMSDQVITIWDDQLNNALVQLKGYSIEAVTVHFSAAGPEDPVGGKMIISGSAYTSTSGQMFKFWETNSGNLLATPALDTSQVSFIKYSDDGKEVAMVSGKGIVIWNTAAGKKLAELNVQVAEQFDINFSNDGERVAIIERPGKLSIWDVHTAKLVHEYIETSATYDLYFNETEWSPDGNTIITFVRNLNNSAKVWDVNSGKLLFSIKQPVSYIHEALQFSPDSKIIIIAPESNDAVQLWDISTGKIIRELKGFSASVCSIRCSPDKKKILTASEDGTLNVWEAATGKRLLGLTGHYGNLKNYPRINVFALFSPKCADDTTGGNKIISFTNEDPVIKIWDANTGKLLTDLKGHNDGINDVNFSPDAKFIVSASSDNTIKKWDVASGKCLYTFTLFNNSACLKQVAGGYYQATPGIAKLLHYVTGDLKVISFEQLDVKYNRPDKVLEEIGCTDAALILSYRKAYEKRVKKLGIDTSAFNDDYNVPEADFENRSDILYDQKSGQLSLHITASDKRYTLNRFNLWINEVPLYGIKGLDTKRRFRKNFDTTLNVILSLGVNRIETSVTSIIGAESYRKPLLVNYKSAAGQPSKVYFIGIGINEFADSSNNLKWCVQDINDLAKAMRTKYGDQLIILDTLYNEKVTLANVKALKQKLLQTGINDKVIISYSGHGLLSKDYDYYLSAYPVNFSKPEEGGILYDEVEGLLDSIPARQKLLLLDACHSGEVDKDEMNKIRSSGTSLSQDKVIANSGSRGTVVTFTGDSTKRLGLQNSFELMQSLFVNVGKGTGAIIISASGAVQFAQENSTLGHGVFTYSVIEAMKKFQGIKVSDLKKYIGDRVTELTKGLQRPTTRNEPIAVDWEVW